MTQPDEVPDHDVPLDPAIAAETILMRHPELPDLDPIPVTRGAFPAAQESGWVEAKSPAADAAVEPNTPTEGDSPKETP